MTNRRSHTLSFAAAALFALLLPAAASAQGGSVWDVLRDRARRDGDYGRGYGNGRVSDYDRRVLRDAARRLENRSESFERNLDRALDDSRYDDTRREDRVNDLARNFREAARRFEDRAGDGNDLRRSESEARHLLATAERLERVVGRIRLNSRAHADWSQIRGDLRTVANIYGLRGDFGRRDDDYYGGRNRRRF